MNALLQLLEHGQSYWLDNLTRQMLQNGDLQRRVNDQGLRGMTSNPAIFEKAIAHSADYDEQIEHLLQQGRPVQYIYEALVVSDIQEACDILRPVYDTSEALDGYVSLEVSPHLAHDTQGSIEEGQRLHRAVGRPNLCIKIPGTPAGIPAIEALLFQGICVNVTLLFSIDSYEAVAWAYIRAMERRLERDLPQRTVVSVASFFLSRIDTLTDKVLQERSISHSEQAPDLQALLGKVAVANAKLAYQRFQEIRASERWKGLADAGARPQRLLWASTSTKNSAYDDLLYVEPLIGSDTVNTLPEETIAAIADHGVIESTVSRGLPEARQVMQELDRLGIDFGQLTDQLINEGIQKFVEPYDALLKAIKDKNQTMPGILQHHPADTGVSASSDK